MCFYCAAAETSSTTSVSEGRIFSLEIIADPSALMMDKRSGAGKCKWASDTRRPDARRTDANHAAEINERKEK